MRYLDGPVRQVYLDGFFWGAAGIAVMTVTILLFSAICRQAFAALAGAALFLVGGYVMRSVLLGYVSFGSIRRLILTLGDYNPLILMMAPEMGFLETGWRIVLLSAGAVGSVWMMQKKWKSYEG